MPPPLGNLTPYFKFKVGISLPEKNEASDLYCLFCFSPQDNYKMNAWPSPALGLQCKSPQGAEKQPGCNLGGAGGENFLF